MAVTSAFTVFILALIFVLILILKYLLDNRRFYFLINKIPWSDFKYNFNEIYKLYRGDSKYMFELAFNAMKDKHIETTKAFFGYYWTVIVPKPDDLKIIMNSKDCLDKAPFQKLAIINQGSLFGELDAWQRHHKIIEPFFGTLAVKNFIPIFNEKSKILVKNLERKLNKEEFDVFRDVAALTLEMILNAMELDVDLLNMEESERDVPTKCLEM